MKNARHELTEKEEVDVLAPPLSTFSSHVTIPTTKIIKESQILPVSPPHHHHHHVPPISAITPTQPPSVSSVSPQFPLSSVAPLSHINTGYGSLAAGDGKSLSLVEDLIIELLQSSESKLNKLELKAKPNLEDVIVKNIQVNPVRKEVQTTYKEDINTTIQPKEIPFISQEQEGTPKPIEAKFVTAHFRPANKLKETTVSPKFKENNLPANLTHKPDMTQPTALNKTLKLTKNKTKRTQKKNKASPPKPLLTKPSVKTERYKPNGKMHTKINRSSKNETIKKTEETKKKKDNKTHKPSVEPTYFPYFMDNYCPPECVCYGRVVQCSDKGVEKIPYGIPYNARYILLMNNQINSIQLDVLNEYVSMEFLVLSNNHLTDGAIEGVFVGVSALKRLYLDKNLLERIPTDLPASLEELRLDNNRLSVMSEAAWVRCPSLLVLSLSNNSLGNGSESLPDAVLSPLCSLRTLNLDHNQLISVPLRLPLSIKELYLKGNLIEQFRGGAFNGLSELVLLDLSANRLTNKGLLRESLLNATHLESLNLEGNKLKQVPRHLPLSLKTLNLEGNLITSIKKAAFSTFKNLEHLGLARNKIVKVAPGAFGTLPVLHQLDLCYNTLLQVPRQLPQGLHSVALTHNKIQSVPRDAFCWGNKSLSLSGLVHVQLENNFIDLRTLDTQAFRCLRGFQVVHFY
uniref:Wu:fc23c09 n=1 Tax=Sphaeramia orbicularis TaxID=375764 RepID=A0A673B3V3_9TELE